MLARVINQFRIDGMDHPRAISTIYGECSRCSTTVKKTQYGFDEECPSCGAYLIWGDMEEE